MEGKRLADQSLTFWFRRKYNLPPTDPRFLDMTMEEMETEYWAHMYTDHPVKEEFEDEEFDEDSILAEIEARARERENSAPPPDPGDWVDIN